MPLSRRVQSTRPTNVTCSLCVHDDYNIVNFGFVTTVVGTYQHFVSFFCIDLINKIFLSYETQYYLSKKILYYTTKLNTYKKNKIFKFVKTNLNEIQIFSGVTYHFLCN